MKRYVHLKMQFNRNTKLRIPASFGHRADRHENKKEEPKTQKSGHVDVSSDDR
jgi:hypothetical protein